MKSASDCLRGGLLSLFNVLHHVFWGDIKLFRVPEVTLQIFKRRGKIKSVANSLIGHNGVIDVFFPYDRTVFLEFIYPAFCAESQENGHIPEIIQMMDNGRDPQRAQIGNNH